MSRIGVDLGGTKILTASVHGAEAHHLSKVPTPTGGVESVVDLIAEQVRSVAADAGHHVHEVGVGIPGQVDSRKGVVRSAPNLSGFHEPVELAAMLVEALGGEAHVRVGNDVSVAALGELRHGAAAEVGSDELLAVWCGTGVGGGLALDGKVREGAHGIAGEIGHATVHPDGRPCACGGRGHLEAYAGRASLEREARARHAAGAATRLVEIAGDAPMRSKVWAEALAAGDEVAGTLLDEAVDALGLGIASALAVVDVGLVVIGGGLGTRLGEPFADRVGSAVGSRLFGAKGVTVVTSRLGDDAGVVGAAELFA